MTIGVNRIYNFIQELSPLNDEPLIVLSEIYNLKLSLSIKLRLKGFKTINKPKLKIQLITIAIIKD